MTQLKFGFAKWNRFIMPRTAVLSVGPEKPGRCSRLICLHRVLKDEHREAVPS